MIAPMMRSVSFVWRNTPFKSPPSLYLQRKTSTAAPLKKDEAMPSKSDIDRLQHNTDKILPETGLQQKMFLADKQQRPLRIKLGFDPTSPDLHLGHAVVLQKVRDFQELGHQVVLVVGGFTARIGDPTGRNKTRPPLTPEEIDANAQTYLDQFGKILDLSKVEVRNNSEWLDPLSSSDILKLMSRITVGQLMQRTDFHERYKAQISIGMHELLYPLLQAYDSVHIKADIEMGGTDQLFNCMLGRELQTTLGQAPQIVLCMPLLVGLDGTEKMSKSKGNTIALMDRPADMFGKLMSIPDALISNYLDLVCDFSPEVSADYKSRLACNSIHPMELKKILGVNITARYWSQKDAIVAAELFKQRFQRRAQSQDAFEKVLLDKLSLQPEASLLDLCHALMPETSRSQLRRLFAGRAVHIDGACVLDSLGKIPAQTFQLKVGKRGFYRVVTPTAEATS